MNSEDLEYKIRKYTVKLRKTKSPEKANHYQKKLQEYHQINQYGGTVKNIDDPNKQIIKDLRNKLDYAFEKSKNLINTNPKLLSELSEVISDINNKIKNIKMTGGSQSSDGDQEKIYNGGNKTESDSMEAKWSKLLLSE